MNTCSMCAPNDMNTYPMRDLQACFFGFKYTFFQHTRVKKVIGFINIAKQVIKSNDGKG